MPGPIPTASRPGTPRAVRRRSLLGLATAATLGLSACRIDPPAARETDEARPARDTEVVASAVAAIRETEATVRAAAGDGDAPWATSLLALHAAHLTVLAPAPQDGPATTPQAPGSTTGTGPGLPQVRRDELRLQRRLAAAAGGATSGDLARVLAAASAGVGQAVLLLGAGS